MNIEMIFSSIIDSRYDYFQTYYNEVALKIFDYLKLDDYFIFEVNLVDNDTIKQINRDYRNIDRVTDVISFAFEDDNNSVFLKASNDLPRDLGEILICVDRAHEQALQYGHSFEREMTFLFVHGILHLLGYDHIDKKDEEVMFKLQDEILNYLDVRR